MPSDEDYRAFQTDIIGELHALRAALQQALGIIVLTAGEPNNYIEVMWSGATATITKDKIIAPGLSTEAIQARAEAAVDRIFGNFQVQYGPASGKGFPKAT